MAVTIKDIARHAGVSHSTVSRALGGSPLISATTARRVRESAAALGYRPSAAARSLKTNRSGVIGAIVSSMDDPFFSEILQGIEEGVQAESYSLFVAASQRDASREQNIVQAMVEHRVDGIIICSTSFGAQQGRLLRTYGCPIVVINNQAVEDYLYSICHDDIDGSRQVTRHLVELGHRQIAYLGNAQSGRTTMDRLAGYKQEMEAHGLYIPEGYIFHAPGGQPPQGRESVAHFLHLPDRPTALVCFNDMLAIGVIQCLQQAGLDVPRDLSVAGFDNIVFSAYTYPTLTTFDQPKRSLGTEAARMVLNLIKSSPDDEVARQPFIRLLKGQLLIRKSTDIFDRGKL
jgi:LacI family transcriptional regulator